MNSHRQPPEQDSAGFISCLLLPLPAFPSETSGVEGLVVNEQEGETLLIRNGTITLRIKISKTHGSQSICFLSESVLPGETLPLHKHLNEDELIFLHKGSGLFTLGEKQYPFSEGAVVVVPKGAWRDLQSLSTFKLVKQKA